jgi:two-component system, OmpR family, osmolarity sensor histidine kinase EnvZ
MKNEHTILLNPYAWIAKRLKRFMPPSLFGRALLILVLPTLLLQILVITIFFDHHWGSIQRHLSASLAGEVAIVVERAIRTPPEQRDYALTLYGRMMNMRIRLLPLPLDATRHEQQRYTLYAYELKRRLHLPFSVYTLPTHEMIRTRVALPDQVLQIDVGMKRLESSTTSIFVYWLVCSAGLLTLIAGLFLRGQIRPITQLADAAERFGMGQNVGDFRPSGAHEVRIAGKAFVVMRARILRQISTRTAMLTGISHDLRTPLTRLKLQCAMMQDTEDTRAMMGDIDEMEAMLNEYLEFARGNDESVPSEPMDVAPWLRGIVQGYVHTGAAVSCSLRHTATLWIRPLQMKRAVENIINNALKYGHRCHLSIELSDHWLTILFHDAGEGIPEQAMEEMFRPFTRMETSRNHATGGIGLGLAISRDIVQAHGGKISLRNHTDREGTVDGLIVSLTLPLSRL